MTRLKSTPYSTFLVAGVTMPENFTSPVDSARPLPGSPSQPRKKPLELPHRVEAEAARHDRILDEMAGEEPEVGRDVEFGADEALAELAAALADLGDAVEHQHGGVGELGASGPNNSPRAQASKSS